MSILIKDMEMPKACCFCECSEGKNYWCRAAKRELGVDPYNSVADFCPLVPVPPHGRLIDADALIVDLMDRGVEGLQTDDWYEIQQAVEDAPTIIEAEEGEDE